MAIDYDKLASETGGNAVVDYDNLAKQHGGEVTQAAPEADNRTQYEKNGIAGALFPATANSTERGGNVLSRTIAGAGDALTLPVRAMSGISTGLGTLAGGGSLGEAAQRGMQDLSRTKSEEKGVLGFVQNVALDPTSSPLLLGAGTGVKAAKGALTLVEAALRAGLQGAGIGAASSAYHQAEEGKIDPLQTAVQAGIGLGLGSLATGVPGLAAKGLGLLATDVPGLAAKRLGNVSNEFAKRNLGIMLRGGQKGAKEGMDVENALKHGIVSDTPRGIFEQGQAKLNDLNIKAKEIGSESNGTVNLQSAIDRVKEKFNRQENIHDYDQIQGYLDGLQDKYKEAFPTADISLLDAMKLRTQIGEKARFAKGGFDPESDWKEKIFNNLYDEMKSEIHAKAGTELQAINRAQSEIIPIVSAAKRRMPIAESNNRPGLGDFLTTGIGQSAVGGALGAGAGAATPGDRLKNSIKGLVAGAALAGIRRGAGSATVTKGLYELGQKLAPTAERALPALDAAKYPSGMQWREKEPTESAFDGFGDLLTKKDYAASQKLGARLNPEELDISNLNLEDLPKTRDAALMGVAHEAGYNPQTELGIEDSAEKAKKGILKSLFGNATKEIKMENLSAKKQMEINAAANAYNKDPEAYRELFDAGLVDKPFSAYEGQSEQNVHPDDIIGWANDVIKQGKSSKGESIADALKRRLGNERGAVGFRYGDAPESGQSFNSRTNQSEKGVSMASVAGLPESRSFATMSAKESRPVRYYEGDIVGTGGDDEKLFKNLRLLKKSEYNFLLKTPESISDAKKIAQEKIDDYIQLRNNGYNIKDSWIEDAKKVLENIESTNPEQAGSAAVPMMGLTAAGSGATLTAALLAKKKLDEQKAKRK